MGVRILERLSRLLIGTGYSISGLHVRFSPVDSGSRLFSFFVTVERARGAFLIEVLLSLLTEVLLHRGCRSEPRLHQAVSLAMREHAPARVFFASEVSVLPVS